MTNIDVYITFEGGKKQKAVLTIPKTETHKLSGGSSNKSCGKQQEQVVGINASGKPIKAIEPTRAEPTDSLSKKGSRRKKTM